jgi:hypothetical protein
MEQIDCKAALFPAITLSSGVFALDTGFLSFAFI